ncbi:1-acyl-sn-glycerol-3-phosphate acyltransferase [Reyranella sp.]|uniref:1-acyl-sn-glycerol-3-phosphate acyltransferase n=1 Tax=Reyranella sp. TaxID=1929291 RepID=UPI0027270000|nr:1-acyl-sn-glycerol-3-phosphate acyltransferase [Reyranella sp.]MDO8975160.1 1-acyl-sn-glycerol-3-phosphate acyltransferase [Reyranella sp.]
MGEPVTVPLWLFVAILAFALWSLLDRLLIPSGRWFLRRRLNRLIDRVNRRLAVEIKPFQLTKRQVLIDRLIYDPQVVAAANEHARTQGVPREVAMTEVHRYAREIVPTFNAYIYFRVGYSIARTVARFLYRVRLGYADERTLAGVSPDTTVVFVMNHRSNMDYVLVAFLAAERTALSYAVGEWARIWPLQQLIRSMGAYFVRRNSDSPIYRRVLERYVHMATEAGVAQAMYPEGGLSRDGRLREPKLGLFDYMLKSFDPKGTHDIVFVPVALNYDRVLEDRTLLRSLDREAGRRSAWFAVRTALAFWASQLGLMLRGQWHRFGYACVNFGGPISARGWLAAHGGPRGGDLRTLDKEQRFEVIGRLANDVMDEIARLVPVLPVSLMATVLLEAEGPLDELELKVRASDLIAHFEARGAKLYLPRGDRDYAFHVGLRMLSLRHLLEETGDGLFSVVATERPVLAYYANAIAHLR